ncbi:MAG: AAA family ATPase, partial [Lachnospiraceae bacterium]|nr:AAA family ATPase [Lachnospiraceae bacterium]
MGISFPLGKDDFYKIRQDGDYYVDKTGLIEELLEESFEVKLITRPRRFGKTLTMTMLEDFFDISRDSRTDFAGLAICKKDDLCSNWMNQWPTVFLTLKSVNGKNFESAYGMFKSLIADICEKYSFLEKSDRVDNDDKKRFQRLKSETADDTTEKNSLFLLTRMLYAHYGKPVILLIDEYDVPLAKADDSGYYDEMLEVIRTVFDKALKSNRFLKFAVITGCLKIVKESIFTGTNNFVSDSITGGRFEEYIGFTEENVEQILKDTHFLDHREEIKNWYDGYHFGSMDVYCPWDVLNHVSALLINPKSKPHSYWENTSHNNIIRRFIDRKDLWEKAHINDDFEVLLAGGSIVKPITENLTYDMVNSSADNLWSLLYLTGYLTMDSNRSLENGNMSSDSIALKIPNEEIHRLFKTTVLKWFEDKVAASDRRELFHALWNQEEEKCSAILSEMLFETISYNDYKEAYYHAFVTGILSYAGYKVKSNAEAGEGRPDILLLDERNGKAIVIEIKVTNAFKAMEEKCEEALRQIDTRRYAKGLGDEYEEILKYGICFYKKRCRVKG